MPVAAYLRSMSPLPRTGWVGGVCGNEVDVVVEGRRRCEVAGASGRLLEKHPSIMLTKHLNLFREDASRNHELWS